jgi:hypothetical protein
LAQSRARVPRVIARQRRQIDAGDGLEQPGRLRVLLDGAAAGQRCDAAFGGRKIQADVVDEIKGQRHARIAGQGIMPDFAKGRIATDMITPH